jgi:hypothetical protein
VLGSDVSSGVEADVNERVGGPGNPNYAWFSIFDGTTESESLAYGAADGSDLSAAYHTYGLYWRNDGRGAFGSMQLYMDGVARGTPAAINNPLWGGGAYCFGGWMQEQTTGAWGGGVNLGSTTSSNNPLYVRRFTVWKGE